MGPEQIHEDGPHKAAHRGDHRCGDRGASCGLGPGLLESAYEACLVKELMDRGYSVAPPGAHASAIQG